MSKDSIHIWSRNSCPKSEAEDGGIWRQWQSLPIVSFRVLLRMMLIWWFKVSYTLRALNWWLADLYMVNMNMLISSLPRLNFTVFIGFQNRNASCCIYMQDRWHGCDARIHLHIPTTTSLSILLSHPHYFETNEVGKQHIDDVFKICACKICTI